MGGRLPVKVVPLPQIGDVLQVRAYADAAIKAAYSRCSARGRPLYQQAAMEAQKLINQGFDDAGNPVSQHRLVMLVDLLERANQVCDTEKTEGVKAASKPRTVRGDAPPPFDPPSAPPQPVDVPKPVKTYKASKEAFGPPRPSGLSKKKTPWWLWGGLAFGAVYLLKSKKKGRK